MGLKNDKVVPVVLAGGSGTRLWPLSRADYPKQFLSLGSDLSLLQATIQRFDSDFCRPPLVVCADKHRFLTLEQLVATGQDQATIILEPTARNTAPAIALAAWHLINDDPEAVMVVLPADHLMPNSTAFQAAIEQCVELANTGHLVTLGITPTGPETGYGYISAGSSIDSVGSHRARQVSCFVEKPTHDRAQKLIQSTDCYWNAGIFVFKASSFLETLKTLQPDIHNFTRQSIEQSELDLDFLRVPEKSFGQCENISIDYAVMERADNVVVLPFNSDWSDIGSWDSVHKSTEQDELGNSSVGDTLHHNTKNTYLHSSSRLVVALGTSNVSVIETPDAVLVIDHNNAQSIKEAVEYLKSQGRYELSSHTTCYRPWGHYESLEIHPRFQVKRISVKPKAKLSLQKHFHRSEHWVVVKGTAIVTIGEDELLLSENESTYIPLGTMHRLFNPGTIPLELIEVQSGSYLGEDDIVRVGDEYGRS